LGTVYVNVSRGFRQADGVITDPAIPFITSWAYEAGLKVDQPWLSGNLAFFLTDVSNEQTFDPITQATTNGGRSRRQGVEVEFAARLARPLQITGDWTFTDATYKDFITEEGEDLSGSRIFNTAEYVGITALDLAIPRQPWHARMAMNVVGPYTPFDEPGVSLPAYALFHLSGDARLGAATLELGVRNLLNHAYPEIRAGGFVAPGQPRTVYAGVKYALNRPATAGSQIP
jgi:iron complex outermembrane recepter protein